MRIAVLGVQIPFARGGAEMLVEAVHRELTAAGHTVDVVTLPFNDVDRESLLASVAFWRALPIAELPGAPVDLVVATKFPSYLVRHPNKVVWLLHQYRSIYDMARSPYTNLFADQIADEATRELLVDLDTTSLREARRVFTISNRVRDRLQTYNGVDAEVLYHPPPLAGLLEASADDGATDDRALFTVSRLERNKRLDLMLHALALSKSDLSLRIAGTGSQRPFLEFLAENLGIADRVELLGAIPDEQLAAEYARCRGVVFVPFDEDYGYVTLEAFLANKPVLTVTDSGGVLEFVEDGATGWVTEPTREALAVAIDELADRPEEGRRRGRAGFDRVAPIGWGAVVPALTGEAPS